MSHTYLALAFTIIAALFVRQRLPILIFILISARLAVYQDYIDLYGALALSCIAIITYVSFNLKDINQRFRFFLQGTLAFLLGEILLHHIPGFNNAILLKQAFISPLSKTYSMYFNVDKIFSALIVYAGSNLILNEKYPDLKSLKLTLYILLACVAVIITPGVISGYVKFNPKIPAILPAWVINNLIFVCFSEEVIFRGFLQNTFISTLPNKPKFAYLAILVTAIIFGLFHFRDGPVYMVLAGVCGLFYGYTYLRTNRILCAMLVHFLLNFTHFLLFTYPSALKLAMT